MKVIILNDDEYLTLLSELQDLVNYQWNDDCIHVNDCYSESLITIEKNTYEKKE